MDAPKRVLWGPGAVTPKRVSPETVGDLARQVRKGEVRAVARAISLFESSTPAARTQAQELLATIFPNTGNAFLVGITGPPGVGKSSLVDQLVNARLAAAPRKKVACLLVDPTNQFTGGSILGDRIRFGVSRVLDKRVFIRSMAAGSRLGGLSHNIREAVAVLEAAGYDFIIIETVGVGQSEIEIVKVAQTVVLVCQPASGDSIQMLKSGITEMGHVLAVNKADLAEIADEMYRTISASVSLHQNSWKPVVLKTSVQQGFQDTITALYKAVISHRKFLEESGSLAKTRQAYLETWVRELVERGILERVRAHHPIDTLTAEVLQSPAPRSPYQLADEVLTRSGMKRKE